MIKYNPQFLNLDFWQNSAAHTHMFIYAHEHKQQTHADFPQN